LITPVEAVTKARNERNFQVFKHVVLAGYELARGNAEGAEADARTARALCVIDYGDGPVSLDRVVEEFLK
jgi:hypothetical protein